ncbi:MAG: 23S rRNA (pseudouridine(1915)-N(3))-methyltransferase RlmH [Clostridia bacterium]|jgi:23S rRNA (pseudouridine1915-N3)-methyltransferase|nr:23S rRNA (pseudouridine(1915)-N(3))-methyltransferase RlmH [Clostridia bacterium]
MKLRIICVGKLKEKFYRDAADEFIKRISRFAEVETVELADEKAPEKLSAAELEGIKLAEGRRILAKLTEADTVIALDIAGKQFSSTELAEKLKGWFLGGKSRLAFIIGGSNGLSKEVLDRAELRLSFSKMTFSHQIFRVMLLEQLYRAFKINAGEPYHK